MKKLALTLLATASLFALASCNNNQNLVNNNNNTGKVSFKQMAENSAISGINMLNEPKVLGNRAKALTDEQKQLVLSNLNLVDELLQGEPIKSEEVALKEGDQYFDEFDKYYTLTVNQIDGTKDAYKFYYKETLLGEEKEDDEHEVSSRLDGMVVFDEGLETELRYKMLGNKEVETEGKEQEIEYTFTITSEKDPKNRVVVKQEKETGNGENENEYVYSKYDDKGLVEKVRIEYELEGDEESYSVCNITKDNKSSMKYKKEGNKIKVIINNNGDLINAKLELVDGNYQFV